MPSSHHQNRPGVEWLDARLVMSVAVPAAPEQAAAVLALTSPIHPVPGSHPSANPNRPFTPADLQTYAKVYLSFQGASDFNPQYDFNGTGFIGQPDATPILRGLAGITPRIPLQLQLALAPGEQVLGHHPSDNGGVTQLGTVTVVGKTTPNSIVFIDGPTTATHRGATGNFKFQGGALATNSQGYFFYTIKLAADSHSGSLTAPVFLIRTPFNQQLIRAFPILRIR